MVSSVAHPAWAAVILLPTSGIFRRMQEDALTVPVYDLSFLQENPPTPKMWTTINGVRVRVPRFRIRHGRLIRRDPKTITGITLHQSDCNFQVTDLWRQRARREHIAGITGTDVEDTAKHLRALYSSAAHIFVMGCGHIVQVCPLDWYDNSADGLNASTISIEIEGKFPGLMGEEIMSPDLLVASMDALRHIVTTGREAGMPLWWIYAHRQSNRKRRPDPGEEIWRRIVTGYAVPTLGLEARPGFHVGTGRPIPVEWDDEGGQGHY